MQWSRFNAHYTLISSFLVSRKGRIQLPLRIISKQLGTPSICLSLSLSSITSYYFQLIPTNRKNEPFITVEPTSQNSLGILKSCFDKCQMFPLFNLERAVLLGFVSEYLFDEVTTMMHNDVRHSIVSELLMLVDDDYRATCLVFPRRMPKWSSRISIPCSIIPITLISSRKYYHRENIDIFVSILIRYWSTIQWKYNGIGSRYLHG